MDCFNESGASLFYNALLWVLCWLVTTELVSDLPYNIGYTVGTLMNLEG
jgi:hypothetical protein